MASREMRRNKEKLEKRKKSDATPMSRKLLPIPTLIIIALVAFGLVFGLGSQDNSFFDFGELGFAEYDGRQIKWEPGNYFALKRGELMNRRAGYSDEAAFRAILPYMIFHTAIMIDAEKNGLEISKEEVEEIIKYSYKNVYNKANIAERKRIFNNIKEEETERKYLARILEIDSEQNPNLVLFIKKMGAYERKFRYVQWSYDKFPRSQVVKYAEENTAQFSKIKLSRLAVKDEAKAKEAYEKIKNAASSFEEQQIELKSGAVGGEATWQPNYRLLSVIGDPKAVDDIFSMIKGDISEVVQVGSDWIIYKCEEAVVNADLTDIAVIEEIKDYIYNYEKGKIEEYFEARATEFKQKAEAASFDDAVKEFGLTGYFSDFFPLNVKTNPSQDNLRIDFLKTIPEHVDPTASLTAAQNDIAFFTEVFSLKKNELTTPVLLPNKVAVLQFIEDRTLSEEDLEKIGTDFSASIQQNKYVFLQIVQHLFHTPTQPLQYNPEAFEQLEYYSLFIDNSKMPTPAEQDEQFKKALKAYTDAFEPK